MEHDTPDLEHCQRLEEAGWEKETKFIWRHKEYAPQEWRVAVADGVQHLLGDWRWYHAPLLTELLRELGTVIDNTTHGFALTQRPWVDKHEDGYHLGIGDMIEFNDPNPCNAAAKLWIWKEARR